MSTPENNQQEQQQQAPQQPRSYNPFIDVVNEKPYTTMSVNANPSQVTQAIPEPTYQPNAVSPNENPYKMLNSDFGSAMGEVNSGASQAPINPALNNLPSEDVKMGAANLAKLIIDGYEQLHVFGNKWMQISKSKIKKLVSEGEIDLSVPIPYEYGKFITGEEFIEQYNIQNEDALTVSKEFKKEVTPVLTRVLEKKGAALTDEQLLGYYFAKDLASKGILMYQAFGIKKEMIQVMKDYTLAVKENGGTIPNVQRPTTPPPAPSRPAPTPEPQFVEPNHSSDRFNFEDNEAVMASTVQAHKVPASGRDKAIAARKKDEQMKAAFEKTQEKPYAYEAASKTKKTGKRGRKPKDYLQMDEEQIAEAIVLRETKEVDKDRIEGLD